MEPLLKLANIVKIDFLATKGEARKSLIKASLRARKIEVLAEKVETEEEVNDAIKRSAASTSKGTFSAARR